MGIGATWSVWACGKDTPAEKCQSLFVPGSRVAPSGIKLRVRNARGRAIATGTAANAVGEGLSLAAFSNDSLEMSIGVSRPGTYVVRATKQFYRDTTVSNVTVYAGD